MLDFQEIIERIKDIISNEILCKNRMVFDKDVAKVLGLEPKTFTSKKIRKRIPYKRVMDFCKKRDININHFFYNKIFIK